MWSEMRRNRLKMDCVMWGNEYKARLLLTLSLDVFMACACTTYRSDFHSNSSSITGRRRRILFLPGLFGRICGGGAQRGDISLPKGIAIEDNEDECYQIRPQLFLKMSLTFFFLARGDQEFMSPGDFVYRMLECPKGPTTDSYSGLAFLDPLSRLYYLWETLIDN